MATIEGLTKDRMLQIEAASVVDGDIAPNGHLILTTHGGTQIDAGNLMQSIGMVRDVLYPVGSIYLSTTAANPGVLMGGTWTAWGTGRVPVGVDTSDTDFDAPEKTGGAKTQTLTAAQSGLPAHNHTQNAHNHTQNAHGHTQDPHSHAVTAHGHFFYPTTEYHSFRWGNDGLTNVYLAGTTMVAGVPPSNELATFQGGATQTQAAATSQTASAGTATNQATTATNIAATATNIASTAADATASHSIQQKFISCYMWKRTA